jgi:hypothetical protein
MGYISSVCELEDFGQFDDDMMSSIWVDSEQESQFVQGQMLHWPKIKGASLTIKDTES